MSLWSLWLWSLFSLVLAGSAGVVLFTSTSFTTTGSIGVGGVLTTSVLGVVSAGSIFSSFLPPSRSILPTGLSPANCVLARITSCSCCLRFSWFSFSCSIRIASRSLRLSSTISLETARLFLSALNLFERNSKASSVILVFKFSSISIFLYFLSSSTAVAKEMFKSFKTLLILIVFPSLIYMFLIIN